MSRTVVITIEIEINPYEDNSGLLEDEFAQTVYELVKDERNELATEARIAAYKLCDGMTKDLILMERAEDELIARRVNCATL